MMWHGSLPISPEVRRWLSDMPTATGLPGSQTCAIRSSCEGWCSWARLHNSFRREWQMPWLLHRICSATRKKGCRRFAYACLPRAMIRVRGCRAGIRNGVCLTGRPRNTPPGTNGLIADMPPYSTFKEWTIRGGPRPPARRSPTRWARKSLSRKLPMPAMHWFPSSRSPLRVRSQPGLARSIIQMNAKDQNL